MLRIFIENRELDLDKSVQVAITKQFEDLTNPTVIINDWSKTVSIPFTAQNNKIFGYIFNADRVTSKSSNPDQPLTGLYFDPYKKLDMRLQWGDAVVMHGYAKINDIRQKDGKGTYNMTLFGQLGRVLQEMQKVTFDKSYPDSTYIINGSQYVDEFVSHELVAESWASSEPYYYNLYDTSDSRHRTLDIIGFAPNNSFNDDFDYGAFQKYGHSTQFTDLLDKSDKDHGVQSLQEATGVDGKTAIPDGLLPREIGEYRSYQQLPFIYWHKLWQIWQKKCEEVTGYQFDLDSTWFNYSNPYYGRLVYMLKGLMSQDGEENAVNSYHISPHGGMGWSINNSTGNHFGETRTVNMWYRETYKEAVPGVGPTQFSQDGVYHIPALANLVASCEVRAKFVDMQSTGSNLTMNKDNALLFSLLIVDATTGEELARTTDIIKHPDCTIDGGEFMVPYDGSMRASDATEFFIPLHAHFYNTLDTARDVKFKFQGKWVNTNWPGTGGGISGSYILDLDLNYGPVETDILNFTFLTNGLRSGAEFTLNDLWNNDYSLFTQMINYCKMFRIGVRVNDAAKTIEFKPIWKYFENWTSVDWTNKLDKSKDYIITPTTFENKYVLFNYEDKETEIGEKYREKFGYDYGEYRLTTDYNFNDETKELFEEVFGGITNTDNVLSWTTLYDKKKIVYSFPAEIYVDCKDSDRKYVDQFGAMFFHCGLSYFSTEEGLDMRPVIVSDDSTIMLGTNTFFYGQGESPCSNVISYPHLDVVYGDNMCLFNVPMENYTYRQNYSDKMSIYSNFWDEYIAERYNTQNKKITCYVDLKPLEYINFDYRKFVKIGNQLCMVNKIYDYDVQGTGTTKADLLTVQDVTAYTSNPFTFDYIELSSKSVTIPYDHYKKVTVYSTKTWELRDNEYRDTVDVWPTSGNAGTTTVYVGSIDEENIIDQLEFMQINPDAETASDYYTDVKAQLDLNMVPASEATIDTDPWFNEVVRGGTKQVTVTSSGGAWRISAVNKPAGVLAPVSVQPTTGSNGSTTLTFMTTDTTPLGVYDYFMENASGDIQTIRLYVTAS